MQSLELECFRQETTTKTVGRKPSGLGRPRFAWSLGHPEHSLERVGNFGGEGVAAPSP